MTHAGSLWAEHACVDIKAKGTSMHVTAAAGPGTHLRVTVYGARATPPPPRWGRNP